MVTSTEKPPLGDIQRDICKSMHSSFGTLICVEFLKVYLRAGFNKSGCASFPRSIKLEVDNKEFVGRSTKRESTVNNLRVRCREIAIGAQKRGQSEREKR